jgi:hypothetical protein
MHQIRPRGETDNDVDEVDEVDVNGTRSHVKLGSFTYLPK